MPGTTEPTAQDIRNSAAGYVISNRQQREYTAALVWAKQAFVPGWIASDFQFHLSHDRRECWRPWRSALKRS
jgi:hypothetical protein